MYTYRNEQFGIPIVGNFVSEKENVDEDILELGQPKANIHIHSFNQTHIC